MSRLENLLGAQALALTDRLHEAGAEFGAPTERAALVTLLAHPGRRVSWIGDVVGLTSSGVTRLVTRLTEAGWVTSSPGADARSRRLTLTPAGRRRAQRVLQAREAALADALLGLSRGERDTLEGLLDRLVGSMAEERPRALQVCRLCDRPACSSGGSACPLEHTTTGGPGGAERG